MGRNRVLEGGGVKYRTLPEEGFFGLAGPAGQGVLVMDAHAYPSRRCLLPERTWRTILCRSPRKL